MNKLDMTRVSDLLSDAMDDVEDLNDVDWDDADSWKNDTPASTREHVARVNRQLMHLADQLLAASVEVKREYWKGKGYE